MTLEFHPAVQKDFNEALDYYEAEGGVHLAGRFEAEFRTCIAAVKAGPTRFPLYQRSDASEESKNSVEELSFSHRLPGECDQRSGDFTEARKAASAIWDEPPLIQRLAGQRRLVCGAQAERACASWVVATPTK